MVYESNEIRELLDKDIEALYFDIGEQLSHSEAFLVPLSPKNYVKASRIWMEEKIGDFRELICPSQIVQAVLVDQDNQDLEALVLAIADLVAGVCLGVSPVTVSVLLVKIGLKKLCSESSNE